MLWLTDILRIERKSNEEERRAEETKKER